MQLHHRFIKTAKENKDKLAYNDMATGKKIPYERALIASLIFSGKFKKYDKGFIGIMIPTSAGCSLSVLGALMSGRVPVMINYSTGADENARYAQRKCDFRTIITSKALLEKIDCPVVDGMVFIEDIMESISIVDKLKAAITAKMPARFIQGKVHKGGPDDNAVILFTSGSEKDPKAVQLTHRNIWSNVEAITEAFQLTFGDRMLALLPFFHVFGHTAHLWLPLFHGMTSISYANPLDYGRICEIIRDEKPTMVVGTPSFLRGYLMKSAPGDFSSVRIMVAGADKCPDALREGYLQKHGITLLEGYGTTETSPAVSANTPENNRPGSIGKVLTGVEVKIENYETGEVCATGEIGRILVKGDLVMKGYFDDLEETSMRIRKGWYDTGDMGYMDEDGYLWHSGRLKRFVKIGGEMVSLVKVENVLEEFIPKDTECCLVEVPDTAKGAKIVAAVTIEVDRKKTLKQMSEKLPNISLPKEFVVIQEFPKMGSGKIDFRSVTDMVYDMLHKKD